MPCPDLVAQKVNSIEIRTNGIFEASNLTAKCQHRRRQQNMSELRLEMHVTLLLALGGFHQPLLMLEDQRGPCKVHRKHACILWI